MDKQAPAARGANPGASQLSHPAMKQSAGFIESRSPAPSRRRCCSGIGTSSSPRELPRCEGRARGTQERPWPPSHHSPAHTHNVDTFLGRWIRHCQDLEGLLGALTVPMQSPVEAQAHPEGYK